MTDYDLVLAGGRVIDPETGRDETCDVGLLADRVAAIGPGLAASGRTVLDVTGQVVTAGFIDLHSHANTVMGLRLQAFDGVTTALELEAGVSPVSIAYQAAADEGRPVNYGFSASWGLARMAAVAGFGSDGRLDTFLHNIGDPAWQQPATTQQEAALLDQLAEDLGAGALGIGILVGYAPDVDPAEYLKVAALAASAGRPTYTHARELVESNPQTVVDGAEEIVRAAAETGCQMHYCHVNSTSRRDVDRVLGLVERARTAGSRISLEAYPYGSGMTGIGAAFLAPEKLGRWGITPQAILYAPTGERVADADRLAALRAADPGGLAIIDFFDERDPAQAALVMRALMAPEVMVASDAMPLGFAGEAPDPLAWPPPPGTITHPRTAGTFSRALRRLTREGPGLGLMEVLRRCSLLPAQLLETSVPGMRGKGRLQVGADADVVVFDPATVSDQATYTETARPSTGFRHVLVNGVPVVRDGALMPDAFPGRAVRANG